MIHRSCNEYTDHDTVGRLPDAYMYLVVMTPHSVQGAMMMGVEYQL